MLPHGKLLQTPREKGRKRVDDDSSEGLHHLCHRLRPGFKDSHCLGLLGVVGSSQYLWLTQICVRAGVTAGGREGPGSELWETCTRSQNLISDEKLSPGLMPQGDLQSPVPLFCHTHAHTALPLPSLRTVPQSRAKTQGDLHDGLIHTCLGFLPTLTLASPGCSGRENVLQRGGADHRTGSPVSVAVPGSGGQCP